MLRYSPENLSADAVISLDSLTQRVCTRGSRVERYKLATRLFSAKSPARTFSEVKSALSRVSPHVDACYYCERDRHRDIDHVAPKSLFPELAFVWDNYVYACTICNQDEKRSKYAIVQQNGELIDCRQFIGTDDVLPQGEPAFLNPRYESGLEYFDLDLETGILIERADLMMRERSRARYTRETLDLNADGLTRMRRQAYRAFRRFVEAVAQADEAGDRDAVARLAVEVGELGHPTVMVESWRKRAYLGQFGSALEQVYDLIGLSKWDGADRQAA